MPCWWAYCSASQIGGHNSQRGLRRHLAREQQRPQVHAVHVFHHQEEQPAHLAKIMHGHDGLMAQAGERAGLPGETLGEMGIFSLPGEMILRATQRSRRGWRPL